jgi:hypothetical protein
MCRQIKPGYKQTSVNASFRQRKLLSIGADKTCPTGELGLVNLGKVCDAKKKNLTCCDMNETHDQHGTLLNKENHLV